MTERTQDPAQDRNLPAQQGEVETMSVREGMFGPIADQMAGLEGLTPEAFEAERAAGSPLERLQKPEEVGAIVVWVAAASGMGLNGRLVYTEAHVGRVP